LKTFSKEYKIIDNLKCIRNKKISNPINSVVIDNFLKKDDDKIE
jgi:hypothetical protein